MIKDIIFILIILSITGYAHTNKNEILSFIEDKNDLEHITDLVVILDTSRVKYTAFL